MLIECSITCRLGLVNAVEVADLLHEFRLEIGGFVGVEHDWLSENMHPLELATIAR